MINSIITLDQIEARSNKQIRISENVCNDDKVNSIKFTKDSIIKDIKNNMDYNTIHNFISSFKDPKAAKLCMEEYISVLNVANEFNNDIKNEMIIKLNEIMHFLSKRELNLLSNLIYNESSLSEFDKSKIQQSISNEKVIDRILTNHNKLSKQYCFDNYFCEYENIDIHDTIFNICEMIDEYSINTVPYGKYNIMLEEISYLFMKKMIQPNHILSEVTAYIVMKYANKDLYSQLSTVASNNKILSESFGSVYQYYIESSDYADSNDVKSVIKKFNKEEIKNEGILRRVINIIYTKSPASIIDGTPNILTWIRDIMILGIIGVHPIIGILTLCTDKFIQMDLRRKQAEKLVSYFEKEENKIIKQISNAKEGKKKENLEEYLKAFKQSQNKIISYRDSLYSEKELDRRNAEMYDNEDDYMDIEEFKIFKFQNIASLILDANKVISNIVKNAKQRNKYKNINKINIKNLGFNKLNKFNIKSMIGESGKFSYCVSLLDISQCDNENDIHIFLNNIVEGMNLSHYKDNVIFTYTIMKDEAAINVTYNKPICIYENNELVEDYFDEADLYQCNKLFTISKAINVFTENSGDTIVDAITKLYKESFNNDIEEIISDYKYICNSNNIITENSDYIPFDYSNIIYMAEASSLMNYLFTELSIGGKAVDISVNINDTKENNKTKQSEISKDSQRGNKLKPKKLDLNSIKLAMHNLKQKVRNMGQKEKELSRSIDITFNGMTKGIERALVSDRREAIIRGSIIPSFSKAIKTAIVTGGAFLISPTIAAIGAISALAMSKHLTKKERMLLVDEIDIELKVVDRELQRVDNNDKGSTEKYRALVTYQKELQREKQRIMYNLNLAGRPLPNIDNKK